MINLNKLTHQVSVVMCSWKYPELLKACIPSIQKSAKLDTKIFVALNEGDKESMEYLADNNIDFVRVNDNYGTQTIDMLIPFLKSEYVINSNDDMIYSEGWDEDLVNIIKSNSPCSASCRLVEKQRVDGTIVLQDLELPNFFDPNAHEIFNNNVKGGRYPCNRIHGYFHPIMVKTEDYLGVNGYSDNMDLNWFPGHSLDDWFPYRLWKKYNYQFIITNSSFVYHGSSLTNKKLKKESPEKDAKHNSEYFANKAGISRQEFKRLISEGQRC